MATADTSLLIEDLGLIDYGDAWRRQLAVHAEVVNGEEERLLVCEHPKVITLGRGTPPGDLVDPSIPTFEVERGGKATMHLPGQIVVYPIVDLKRRNKDLRGYLRSLERAVIQCLGDCSVAARAIRGKTGVWVGPRKIASIGVAVRKWVTFHGVAFNVDCDLKQFFAINPCGFSAAVMTSVKEELTARDREIPADLMGSVRSRFLQHILENLSLMTIGPRPAERGLGEASLLRP